MKQNFKKKKKEELKKRQQHKKNPFQTLQAITAVQGQLGHSQIRELLLPRGH